ncbi:EAL domain-containing protein [Mesorhizobium sp. CAU 1732]|uniref:EAL domain-containing protein n=1 Tax=Mesorhizobium sp. CAU 1732 TaxID=3140358 RepID=UPI003261346D
MTTFPSDPDTLITLDEIGLASASVGDHVLRTAFDLCFKIAGDRLVIAAVSPQLQVFRDGRQIRTQIFLREIGDGDRRLVHRLEVPLHLRNLLHLGIEDVDHVIDLSRLSLDDDLPASEIGALVNRVLADTELDPRRIVARIDIGNETQVERARGVLLALQSLGAHTAVGGSIDGYPPVGAIRALRPDLAVLDSRWLARVTAKPEAVPLLQSLIERMQDRGATVMVEGIETAGHAAAAFAASADWVSGAVLSKPSLAGTLVEPPVYRLSDLLRAGGRPVPLVGGIRS